MKMKLRVGDLGEWKKRKPSAALERGRETSSTEIQGFRKGRKGRE